MTSIVRLVGWSRGLKKVALTKLIREFSGIPLNKAHEAVNNLLAGKDVEVAVPSEDAQKFAAAVCNLGAKTEHVESEPRTGTYG